MKIDRLNKNTIKEIKASRKRIRKGDFYNENQAKKILFGHRKNVYEY